MKTHKKYLKASPSRPARYTTWETFNIKAIEEAVVYCHEAEKRLT